MTEAKELDPAVKPWPLFGYAPGNYSNRCVVCEQMFVGDKRAVMCLECAARQANKALTAPVALDVKPLEWRNVDASPQSDDWWFEASTPFGNYTVTFIEEHTLPWLLEPFRSNLASNYATEDEAMSAGAADYAARILSAINPTPSREAVIEEPIAYLRDVGSNDDPCYAPAAKGDPGAFPVYAAIRALPSNAPSLGEARLAEGEAVAEPVAWNCIYPTHGHITLRGDEAEAAALAGAKVQPLYAHPSHVQAEVGEPMKPIFGTPSGYVEVPPADIKGDEELARHWIDRYAAGIDEEPQMSRIRAALKSEERR